MRSAGRCGRRNGCGWRNQLGVIRPCQPGHGQREPRTGSVDDRTAANQHHTANQDDATYHDTADHDAADHTATDNHSAHNHSADDNAADHDSADHDSTPGDTARDDATHVDTANEHTADDNHAAELDARCGRHIRCGARGRIATARR
jgi:hypothetical protein